jgi:hypothetical protein
MKFHKWLLKDRDQPNIPKQCVKTRKYPTGGIFREKHTKMQKGPLRILSIQLTKNLTNRSINNLQKLVQVQSNSTCWPSAVVNSTNFSFSSWSSVNLDKSSKKYRLGIDWRSKRFRAQFRSVRGFGIVHNGGSL